VNMYVGIGVRGSGSRPASAGKATGISRDTSNAWGTAACHQLVVGFCSGVLSRDIEYIGSRFSRDRYRIQPGKSIVGW
jgi:hypothetical protein